MNVTLQSITPNAEVNIVEIARVSSPRKDKTEKPEGLINYLIKHNHWSPFEHSHITVEITTSKAIGIQLLRHVSCRFQELSQRYAKVEKVEPIEFRWQAEKNRQSSTGVIATMEQLDNGEFLGAPADMLEISDEMVKWLVDTSFALEAIMKQYEEGLNLGIAKECVRMILPMATSTTIYMTGSIRSWIHFLAIRDDEHAQKEVQLIAKEIKRIFIEQLPIISVALGYTTKEQPQKERDEHVKAFVKAINDADIHYYDPVTGERKEVRASKKEDNE